MYSKSGRVVELLLSSPALTALGDVAYNDSFVLVARV